MASNQTYLKNMPKRIKKPSIVSIIGWVLFLALFIQGLYTTNITPDRLWTGLINMMTFLARAFPPDATRLSFISSAMFSTFQMALVGTAFGTLISLPVALLASVNTSPSPIVAGLVRSLVSVIRTIPDLIWALIFVISVGLGPLAGILTITVDTVGFCARFFSERIEELDAGPIQALEATGSSKAGVIMGSVIPMGFPSFVATSLYALEKAIRSAVVLGLVGAGGIGVELSTAMTLRRFDEALMIMILILVFVIATEKVSTKIRKQVI